MLPLVCECAIRSDNLASVHARAAFQAYRRAWSLHSVSHACRGEAATSIIASAMGDRAAGRAQCRASHHSTIDSSATWWRSAIDVPANRWSTQLLASKAFHIHCRAADIRELRLCAFIWPPAPSSLRHWADGADPAARSCSSVRHLHTEPPDAQSRQKNGLVPSTVSQKETGASFTSPPNLLSLSRVAAAPVTAYLIAWHEWGPALALLAGAGVSMPLLAPPWLLRNTHA